MEKEVVNLSQGDDYPYSQAIKIADCVYVSGQVGVLDSKTGEKLEGIEAQCQQCLENFKKILELADSSLSKVVKVTVFLRHAEDYNAMNEIYRRYFPSSQPTRSKSVCDLVQPDMLIEIDGIAYCSST